MLTCLGMRRALCMWLCSAAVQHGQTCSGPAGMVWAQPASWACCQHGCNLTARSCACWVLGHPPLLRCSCGARGGQLSMASYTQCSGPPPAARRRAKAYHKAAWEWNTWGSSQPQCCPVRCTSLLLQDAFVEKHGVKLGFMSAFVKASADALHLVPAANAVIDGDEIVYRWAASKSLP